VRDLVGRAVAPLSRVEFKPVDRTLNVEADPLQLELAILKLAFNARDAMPEGGVLTISAEKRSGTVAPELPAGDYVAITLADTGIGMSPEVAQHALEPFFTTKGEGGAAGMGLSMAFGVLRQSGGTLSIDSAEGQGTRITLFLKLSHTEPARVIGDYAPGAAKIDLAGRAITLVEDDDQVRMMLVDTLTLAGATVSQASNGSDAIELVRQAKPELLIVDFAMPTMSGAEVVRRVREMHLPVLLVTGFAESPTLDAVIGAQVRVLRKPFGARDLLKCVAELLTGRA
jgi:CheY-like chemotaxis protein